MPRDLPKQTFAINPRDQDEDYSPRMDWKKKPDSKRSATGKHANGQAARMDVFLKWSSPDLSKEQRRLY